MAWTDLRCKLIVAVVFCFLDCRSYCCLDCCGSCSSSYCWYCCCCRCCGYRMLLVLMLVICCCCCRWSCIVLLLASRLYHMSKSSNRTPNPERARCRGARAAREPQIHSSAVRQLFVSYKQQIERAKPKPIANAVPYVRASEKNKLSLRLVLLFLPLLLLRKAAVAVGALLLLFIHTTAVRHSVVSYEQQKQANPKSRTNGVLPKPITNEI